MANESLGKAKSRKNDEFYTVYDYIQKEMNAYLEYDPNVFRGKTILLPCDDPEWSNFTKYFAQNFETLGIKKLISTSYATDRKKQQYEQYHQMTLFELNFPQYDEEKPHSHGKIFTLTRDINKSGVIDIDDLEWQYLEGDGDFRSKEVTKLRDEADFIVTNPPFSLFREFLAWIIEADKKFIIIGNMNAITYKEAFPLIKDNKVWLGATGNGNDMVFGVPEGAKVDEKDRAKAARLGYGLIKNHCMIDGNKRIGTHAMLVFLALNGIELKYTQKELYETILNVASGSVDYNGLLQWVLNHQN